jgi:hypothetical protein
MKSEIPQKIALHVRVTPMPASQAEFIKALGDLLAQHAPALAQAGIGLSIQCQTSRGLTPRAVARIVAEYVAIAYDIDPDQILQTHAKNRKQKIAEARHVSMILTQEFTEESDNEVPAYFNGDRSILSHARKWVADTCDVDPMFKSSLAQMRNELAICIQTAKSENPPRTFDALIHHRRSPKMRNGKCSMLNS